MICEQGIGEGAVFFKNSLEKDAENTQHYLKKRENKVITIQEIQSHSLPLLLQEISGTKYLFANTWSRIYRLPVERCSRFGNSCR